MASFGTVLILYISAILLLTQVEAIRRQPRNEENSLNDEDFELKENDPEIFLHEDKNLSENNKRGILNNIFGQLQQPFVAPPVVIPQAPSITAGLPVPNVFQSNRTLFQQLFSGNPLNNILNGNNLELNLNWVKAALQKCARIDPRLITVVFPTSTNNLAQPEMYYFENTTSMAKSWSAAQEWCTSKGMDLVTVNDINEHRVLQELIKKILANSPVADVNNAFWTGLNNEDRSPPFTWIGDSTGNFFDWHANEPSGPGDRCVTYAQLVSADNIKFDATTCTTSFRYICEVSDECTALFMSRYPKVIFT